MAGNILIDALDFMERNLVVPHHENIGTAQGQAGQVQMCIVPSAQPGRRHGADVPEYVLMRYRGHANAGRFGANREATDGLAGAHQFQAGEQQNQLQHAIGGGGGGAMQVIAPGRSETPQRLQGS